MNYLFRATNSATLLSSDMTWLNGNNTFCCSGSVVRMMCLIRYEGELLELLVESGKGSSIYMPERRVNTEVNKENFKH